MAQESTKPPPEQPAGPSDEWLALRSREGDHGAFDALARRYQDRLYTFALRMIGDAHEAEDLTQETLVGAYRSLGRFDARRRFGAWVYGIAANLCRSWHRQRGRRPKQVPGAVSDMEAPRSDADDPAAVEERQRVRDAVVRLPPKYREVVVLHYIEGMGYDAVARSLGITEPAARRRALRAREKLRRFLDEPQT